MSCLLLVLAGQILAPVGAPLPGSAGALPVPSEVVRRPAAVAPIPAYITLDPNKHGTLVNNTGSVTIDVPAGAVTTTAILLYSPAFTPTLPPPMVAIDAFGITLQPSVTLQLPYIISVQYDDQALSGLGASSLRIVYRDSSNTWVSLEGCTDAEAHLVSAAPDFTGQFALAGVSAAFQVYLPLVLGNASY